MTDTIPPSAEKKPSALRYLHELPRLIERMHRRFLDVIRLELGRIGIRDISPVQAMMLCNIGAEEMAVRDLIERGYYLGSNASYNLKQLVEGGYVERQAGERDRRSAQLKVSPKGQIVLAKIESLASQWGDPFLKTGDEASLETTLRTLRQMERCWSDALRYASPDEGAGNL